MLSSMASPPLLSLLLLLSIASISTSAVLPSQSVADAAEILSDSGFVSMALTLELVASSLVPQSPSLTIFAPPDAAFVKSGQPALSLLHAHFCPLPLPLRTLRSLPAGTKIPTLLSGRSLTVTTPPSGAPISLNNVRVTSGSPLYDDGFLLIFGIQDFFDPNFQLPTPSPTSGPDSVCGPPSNRTSGSSSSTGFPDPSWFETASGVLRSNGYNVMASFLDLQIFGFENPNPMTLFAPLDQAMENPMQDPSVFLRHVVPCRLLWSDLVGFRDGTVLPTYMAGFTIGISRSGGGGGILLLNGVPVFFVNMYYSDSLVVHGLREALAIPETAEESGEEAEDGSESSNEVPFDNTEF